MNYIHADADGEIISAGYSTKLANIPIQATNPGEQIFICDDMPYIDTANLKVVDGQLVKKPGAPTEVSGEGVTLVAVLL